MDDFLSCVITESLSHIPPRKEESMKLADVRVTVRWRVTGVTAELGTNSTQKYSEKEHRKCYDASVTPQAHFSDLILWGWEKGPEGVFWSLFVENQGCGNTTHKQRAMPKEIRNLMRLTWCLK